MKTLPDKAGSTTDTESEYKCVERDLVMTDVPEQDKLPRVLEEYLVRVGRRIRNRRVRVDVRAELRSHFLEALGDDEDPDREALAERLIAEFGDAKLLSALITRAKKRCRPLWVKFVIRSTQAAAILIVFFVMYTVSFFTAKPNPTINYVGELNRMVRPLVPRTLNAAVHYVKAQDLYVEPAEEIKRLTKAPGCEVNENERRELLKWISQNEPALRELRKGAAKPYCWFTYGGDGMVEIIIPDLGPARSLAKTLCWQLWLDDRTGAPLRLDNIKTVHALARHLKTNPATLIEGLVAVNVHNLANTQTLQLVRQSKIGESDLPDVARMLGNLYPAGVPKFDFRGERKNKSGDYVFWPRAPIDRPAGKR